MVVSIQGRRMCLWRAVDSEGEVLDMLVQPRRDKAAALRLMHKLLKKQGFAPKVLVTDKLRSYAAARREPRFSAHHKRGYAKTTEPRTPIKWFDDGSGKCSGSSQPDPPNVFSPPTPPPTTPSISSAI